MEQIEPFVQCRAAAASRQGKYLICFLNSSLWGGCSRRRRRRNWGEIQAFKAGSGVKLSVDADPTCYGRGHNPGHWKYGKLP